MAAERKARGPKKYNHDWYVAKTYGLAPGQYEEMLNLQNGVCAICGYECPTGYRLSVDHNHETGEVRGLLCLYCNRAIGNLRDDPNLADKTASYLRGFKS